MNRGVLILALLCPTLLLGVLWHCCARPCCLECWRSARVRSHPWMPPPSRELCATSWPSAPEQGALRHQLAQRLERGETDEEDPLLSRYQGFLAAESSLTVPTDPGLASLQLLFDEREQLRQQSFTPAEQELALWLAEQPQWFREAEANGRLLGDLQRLEQISPAERDAVLLEQLGPEAVDRLRQLAQSQQRFEQQLAGYLAELEPLRPRDRAEQQRTILARWFDPGQWRRVEALTRIRLGEPASE